MKTLNRGHLRVSTKLSPIWRYIYYNLEVESLLGILCDFVFLILSNALRASKEAEEEGYSKYKRNIYAFPLVSQVPDMACSWNLDQHYRCEMMTIDKVIDLLKWLVDNFLARNLFVGDVIKNKT